VGQGSECVRGRGVAASASMPRAREGHGPVGDCERALPTQGGASDERVRGTGRSCQHEHAACASGA
jgi:hypothetical protein